MSETPRYFIVTKESLADYGAEEGYSTAEETELALSESGDEDLVVIRGELVPTRKTLRVKIARQ